MFSRILFVGLAIFIASFTHGADRVKKDPVTRAEAGMRLRHAQSLARESNDPTLVDQVNGAAQDALDAFNRDDPTAAELFVRTAEKAVGLDPGGKTMNGLPVAQCPKDVLRDTEKLTHRLEAALRTDDPEAVRAVAAELRKALGDQAGLPDARNKGEKATVRPVKPRDVADLFVRVLDADRRTNAALASGKQLSNALPRLYGGVVQGCCDARPLIEQHVPMRLADLDKLVNGCCSIMLQLQTPEGFFRFPDLRGRHIRYGEMIEKLVEKDPEVVRDNWLVVPLPDGGSQYDAGECGTALLQAASLYQNDVWKRAGLKAADWVLNRRCVPNFSYNAFSISLLAEAYRLTKDVKYLDGALKKFRVGVAPGQADNGRWLGAQNARTAFHFIILHSLNDLEEALPQERRAVRDEVATASRKAVKSLLDEFDVAGVTNISHAVPELARYLRQHPDADARLRKHLERSASVVLERCFDEGEVRAGVPLTALAAVARVWKE